MINQYILKIYPAGRGREVYRVMEICGDDTLNQLCASVLDTFDFSDEHTYEFCMDNKMYSRNNYQSHNQGGGRTTDIKLDKLRLLKGQKFSLHYDFGDDWMFTISVSKIIEVESYHKPIIIKEKGTVEQYPDYDDEWAEDWDEE